MTELAHELKQLIIDTLYLEDMTPADIDSGEPLFGDGLGLDSIDALELGLAIKNKYRVTLDAESEDTRRHFSSVDSLAAFIQNSSAA